MIITQQHVLKETYLKLTKGDHVWYVGKTPAHSFVLIKAAGFTGKEQYTYQSLNKSDMTDMIKYYVSKGFEITYNPDGSSRFHV